MKFLKRLCDPSFICAVGGLFNLFSALICVLSYNDYLEAPYYVRALALCFVGLGLMILALLLRISNVLIDLLSAFESDSDEVVF